MTRETIHADTPDANTDDIAITTIAQAQESVPSHPAPYEPRATGAAPRLPGKRGFARWLGGGAIGFALCAALLGGSAFAASGSTSSASALGQAFVDKLAQNLGISSSDLQTKITQSADATVADAVTSGQLTQAQADEFTQQINGGNGTQLFEGMFEPRHGFGGEHVNLDALAATLGMTTADLQAALASGTSVSDIITQHGQTVASVVTALVADTQARLDAAVAGGQLTQAQATQMLAALPQQLTDAINANMLGQHGRPHDNDADDVAPSAAPGTSATPTT